MNCRTERALDNSGISVAPPKRTRGQEVKSAEPSGPIRSSAHLRVKDDSSDESNSSEEGEDSNEESEESEEIEEVMDEEMEVKGEDIEESGEENEDGESGEESGEEIEIENSGPAASVNPAGPVGSPAGPVGGPVSPVGGPAGPVPVGPVSTAVLAVAPASTTGSLDAGGSAGSPVPPITILPATPAKNQGKSNQQDMLVDNDDGLDSDSSMGDNEGLGYSLKKKRGRERSGTGDARGIKTHRRSASHSTAPTVPSTEDDDLDPHGSSRTTGGFIRGRATGNNYNWGDAEDVMHPVDWNGPTYGKVLLFTDRKKGSSPHMTFTTEASSELPVVLKEMSGKFSPIERKDSRIYVFEDEAWEVKGRFSRAMKDKAPLKWDMKDNGELILYLLAVGVF